MAGEGSDMAQDDDAERIRRQAEDELRRLNGAGQGFADSALAQAARKAQEHFAGQDVAGDKVERWAVRSARIAALLFVGYVIIELVQHFNR